MKESPCFCDIRGPGWQSPFSQLGQTTSDSKQSITPETRLTFRIRLESLSILGEARGVGGIFFDDLEEPDSESCFQYVFSCCQAVLPAYIPIVEKHLNDRYTEKETNWQQIRRGRYCNDNYNKT